MSFHSVKIGDNFPLRNKENANEQLFYEVNHRQNKGNLDFLKLKRDKDSVTKFSL